MQSLHFLPIGELYLKNCFVIWDLQYLVIFCYLLYIYIYLFDGCLSGQ